MTLMRLLTWIRMYQRKAFLDHRPMTTIVSGYTLDRKISKENPYRSEWVTNYLYENPISSSLKDSVPGLSYLIVIWDIIFVLWFYTYTVFTGVSSDIPGYDSSLVMISAQTCTGQSCFPVRHWFTVALLTPLLWVLNIRDTLSAMCMHTIMCSSSCRFLYNLIPSFHKTNFHLLYPLGVVEYLHDLTPKKKAPAISCPMAVLKWEF